MLFTPDALAGRLPASRAEVRALFEHAFRAALREGAALAVLAIQLDGFESLGEERGVPYAAAVFCRSVEGLVPHLGQGLLCGWRERERAYLVIQGTAPGELGPWSEELAIRARSQSLNGVGGPASLSLSFGISHAHLPRRGDSEPNPDELVAAAGRCVRLAILAGGNRVVQAERLGARRKSAAAANALAAIERAQAAATKGSGAPVHGPRAVDPAGEPIPVRPLLNLGAPAPSPAAGRQPAVPPQDGRDRSPGPAAALAAAAASGPEEALAPASSPGAPADRALDTRVGRLERRLAKLTGLLEQALERGVRVPKEVERGVASTYREVQGISDQDENGEAKRALMGTIFEANLELRKRQKDRHVG